jgi:hypothetical protein
MSSPGTRSGGALRAARGPAIAVIAVAAAAAIGVAGQFLPVQQTQTADAALPMQGRTSSVCTTGTVSSDKAATDSKESQVIGATTHAESGGTGTLTGRSLGDTGSGPPMLSITSQGQAKIIDSPQNSVVLTADGVMASASAGMVYGSTDNGEDRGLSLGPCTAPAVDQWFTGLGAADTFRSQLVLTNPDDRQAEVDLEFFGPSGSLSVPGGSGLIIPAGTSRTVSLEDLLGKHKGEISVRVRASVGRVSAIARDLRADGHGMPTGVDWHPASAAASTSQVVPAIPGGDGYRKLIIFNPGQRRANIKIEILGPDGPFAPAGAASLSVNGSDSASVDVSDGLAKQIGSVRVTSDQPVLAMVRSERPANGKPTDIAVNTSQQSISSLGIAPAAVIDGSETELAISNGGTKISTADVTLYNTDGVSLYHEKIPVLAGGTIERRVTQAGPAYLVVRTPDGSKLYGGITLRQQTGKVSGLAAAPLITPGLAGKARTAYEDPRVAQ